MVALKSCDRFTSVPISSYSAIFESSWRKVEIDLDQHVHDMAIASEAELEEEVEAMTLGKSRPIVEDRPLWRVDLLRNKKGKSAMVWRLDHSIGDGIGLMSVMADMFTKMDGSAYTPPSFVPARGKKGKGGKGLLQKLSAAVMLVPRVLSDAVEVLSLPAGAFDTKCAFNRHKSEAKELVYDGCRKIVSIDFSLDDVMRLKAKATAAEKQDGNDSSTTAGYTVNDVLCAVWAGCLRRYCIVYTIHHTAYTRLSLYTALTIH
jgi:hypothetical protein